MLLTPMKEIKQQVLRGNKSVDPPICFCFASQAGGGGGGGAGGGC